METIGQRLKRLRLEQGLSQRELASPGVTYAYISRIEAGTRQPSIKALRKLAEKLGVSATYLETGREAIEVVIDIDTVDAYAARSGADITWADLLPEERQQVVAGMHNALAARIGNAIYVTSLNRQLEEGTCSATTAATT